MENETVAESVWHQSNGILLPSYPFYAHQITEIWVKSRFVCNSLYVLYITIFPHKILNSFHMLRFQSFFSSADTIPICDALILSDILQTFQFTWIEFNYSSIFTIILNILSLSQQFPSHLTQFSHFRWQVFIDFCHLTTISASKRRILVVYSLYLTAVNLTLENCRTSQPLTLSPTSSSSYHRVSALE